MITLIIVITVLFFGFVIIFGAPWLPTLKRQVDQAIDLFDLPEGKTILDLGCGDGRVLRRMAQRGYKAVGYELNPIMYLLAKMTTWRYRAQIRVYFGDYLKKDWPKADGIYVFLIDRFMPRLETSINEYIKENGPVTLVSNTFKVPGRKILKKHGSLYLYRYE